MINVKQESSLLHHLEKTRHPECDQAILLLSLKAGLRAKEIAFLPWAMVTDSGADFAFRD